MNTHHGEVLILADYQEIGALMAALVELSGFTAVFPCADERPVAAVRRIAPRVVLLECDLEYSRTGPLAEAMHQVGAVVLLFSPARTSYELEQLATRCGLDAITFPLDRDQFDASLRSALGASRS